MNTNGTAADLATVTTDALWARIREASWKPAHLRKQVDIHNLTGEARTAILTEADRLTALLPVLEAEMTRRNNAMTTFKGYVA